MRPPSIQAHQSNHGMDFALNYVDPIERQNYVRTISDEWILYVVSKVLEAFAPTGRLENLLNIPTAWS